MGYRGPIEVGTKMSKVRSMEFRFDQLRATQAAAVLLKLAGGRENYTKLLKLLYLADRESLAAVGEPIAGAKFCSMKNGPLASDIYNCIKGNDECGTWKRSIRKLGYYVQLVDDPGDSELSDYDVDVLTRLFEKHRRHDYGYLIEYTHTLPEWEDPGDTSVPLPPEEILRAQRVDDGSIAEIDVRNRHVRLVEELLS